MQVDVTSYTEIATHNIEDRYVLDLAIDNVDNSLAVITKETEGFGQQARIYDIGRVRYPVQSRRTSSYEIVVTLPNSPTSTEIKTFRVNQLNRIALKAEANFTNPVACLIVLALGYC